MAPKKLKMYVIEARSCFLSPKVVAALGQPRHRHQGHAYTFATSMKVAVEYFNLVSGIGGRTTVAHLNRAMGNEADALRHGLESVAEGQADFVLEGLVVVTELDGSEPNVVRLAADGEPVPFGRIRRDHDGAGLCYWERPPELAVAGNEVVEMLTKAVTIVGERLERMTRGDWSASDLERFNPANRGIWWIDYDHKHDRGRTLSTVAELSNENAGSDAQWIELFDAGSGELILGWLSDALEFASKAQEVAATPHTRSTFDDWFSFAGKSVELAVSLARRIVAKAEASA